MYVVDRANIKQQAIGIVSIVEPSDKFVVEDGFEDIADNWSLARPQDEGRFVGGPEIATFAALVVPFLLGFFGDVAKDVVKDQAKKAASAVLDRLLRKKATGSEADRLRSEIDSAITDSGFSSHQKTVLRDGFSRLFRRVQTVE